MADEREQVLQANRDFYRAFETLEVEKMEEIWLKQPHIICVHPGWPRLQGWGPIMESWDRIFESTFGMKFDLVEVEVVIRGGLAVVVVEENIEQCGYDGITKSQVMATNVFEQVGDRWYMVLHHGSPVSAPSLDEPPLQ